MKLKTLSAILVVTMLVTELFNSCKAIIEPDISGRQVVANAPGAKAQLLNYNVGFWWEEVNDALRYRLQVVRPTFDSLASLTLDTVVKTSKFYINLTPGDYQWRVRAENGSSYTAFSTPKSFTILQGSLKEQQLQIISPAANALTNQSPALFSWGTLYGATTYHIQVDTANFTDTSHLFLDQSVPGQQVSVTLDKDRIYQWRVRAENDTAQSRWTGVYTLTYDHIPPVAVKLLQPADKGSLTLPVALQWAAVADAVKYKVYLFRADGTTPYSSSFPVTVSTTSYSFSGGNSGDTLYWQASAIDKAGNEGTPSTLRSFTIQ